MSANLIERLKALGFSVATWNAGYLKSWGGVPTCTYEKEFCSQDAEIAIEGNWYCAHHAGTLCTKWESDRKESDERKQSGQCDHRYFHSGGVCHDCGFKHEDHDELLAKLREHLAKFVEVIAFHLDSIELLEAAGAIEHGVLVSIRSARGLDGCFDDVFNTIVGNGWRRVEFYTEFFRTC